jgi:haloalkane dehalogenase
VSAVLRHREAGPADGPVALLLHGYPESSYMWRHLIGELAAEGWRAIAPDFAGYGDSEVDRPATWTSHVEAVERFRTELGLEDVVLIVHDWGSLIGLRWACDHPGVARGLVISDGGFFPDGRWHGLAQAMRTPETGEEVIRGMTQEGLLGLLGSVSKGIDEAAVADYWKAFSDDERRLAQLDLYRSGDFSELAAYEGQLAALALPTLLVWGEHDEFAPVAGAHRFQRELADTQLAVIEGTGHFVWEDEPAETSAAVLGFLRERFAPPAG